MKMVKLMSLKVKTMMEMMRNQFNDNLKLLIQEFTKVSNETIRLIIFSVVSKEG